MSWRCPANLTDGVALTGQIKPHQYANDHQYGSNALIAFGGTPCFMANAAVILTHGGFNRGAVIPGDRARRSADSIGPNRARW